MVLLTISILLVIMRMYDHWRPEGLYCRQTLYAVRHGFAHCRLSKVQALPLSPRR